MRESFVDLCLDALAGPSNWDPAGGDVDALVAAVRAIPGGRLVPEDLTPEAACRYVDAFFSDDFSEVPARFLP